MNETLDFISIHLPTIIISIINLYILFRILKHFLFKPVLSIIAKREQEVALSYSGAEETQNKAEEYKSQYQEKLFNVGKERQSILEKARKDADVLAEKIHSEAISESELIKTKTRKQLAMEKIELEKKAKETVSDMSIEIAQQILQREIVKKDHAAIIKQFVEKLEVV